MTWYRMGEPFLVHTQPNSVPGRPYGMCTVLIPAGGARLARNGVEAEGQALPRGREGRPSRTCVPGLCESWAPAAQAAAARPVEYYTSGIATLLQHAVAVFRHPSKTMSSAATAKLGSGASPSDCGAAGSVPLRHHL